VSRAADLDRLHLRRQVEVARRSDAIADAAGRAVERCWRGVLAAVRRKDCGLAHALLRALPALARGAIERELAGHYHWSWASAVECARGCASGYRQGQVPPRRPVRGAAPEERLDGGVGLRQGGAHLRGVHRRQLGESFDWADLLAPFRLFVGADDDDGGGDDTALDFDSLLFAAPTPERVNAVIYGSGWRERIRSGTGLGSPDAMAARIATGLMLGRTHQAIAKDILPAVEGVRASARRIARTEALRVAQRVQMDAHDQLGDLVIGYQVRATLDANTRPWHRERDGAKYYLDPGPGQKGMAQCPQPPDEAADPAERPAGAPATAWNCRCLLIPILRD
jgi:SPP1 gp7 family putative phage head morphogenesis protein